MSIKALFEHLLTEHQNTYDFTPTTTAGLKDTSSAAIRRTWYYAHNEVHLYSKDPAKHHTYGHVLGKRITHTHGE